MMVGVAAWAAPVKDKHVTAEVMAEVSSIAPGQPFWIALKLIHEEHWHTYWINDGDSGLPTKIRWTLPEGFTAGPIIWPTPQRLPMPPLMSYGFEGTAWLLVEITPPAELATATVDLAANVSWLMCKEICLPGKAAFTLTLPVNATPVIDPGRADDFREARRRLPATETDWSFAAQASDTSVELTLTPPAGAPALSSLYVFARDKGIVASAAEQTLVRDGANYRVTLKREVSEDPLPEAFTAVLVGEPSLARDGTRSGLEISVPFGAAPSASAPTAAVGTTAAPSVPPSLGFIVLSAFLGGMILNLMPCVFPVISLKILGFVNQAGENPRTVWHHGLVFAAGVLVSFWILAGLLIALRATGAGIGWGFQLQSPAALITLSLVFFVLALNLFGVFEFGLSLTSAGGSVTQKQGWSGSFFSGFLATVIATPCTAPFMGVALGYALTQPPLVAFVVFTALALGMSFPYLLLSRYPALLKKLPRPGAWMETMKQIMGFFLLATVIWLFWVLSALVHSITLTAVLAAFLLAGLGTWVLGKWDVLSGSTRQRWIARMVGLLFIAAGATTALGSIHRAETAPETDSAWEAFSPERLAALRAEGKPVFIDFTAKWCLTCQVNKLTVLRTDEVMQSFRDKGVALLYADWTDENEVIAAELARHGRQSVPLYVFYDGTAADPVILPELLTRKIVADALKSLN
jgi:thiol:disulfide interchange protein DsbD